jgi:hypothetical protein
MTKYQVRVEEVLANTISINAENSIEAHDKAVQMYRNEEIVLDANDFEDRTINAVIEVGANVPDKCPGCGENKFTVIEKLYHEALFYEGKLDISSSAFDNETYKVICDNCSAEIRVPEEQLEYAS